MVILLLPVCPSQERIEEVICQAGDGVFGEHLSNGKGEGEGDIQNKIFSIV